MVACGVGGCRGAVPKAIRLGFGLVVTQSISNGLPHPATRPKVLVIDDERAIVLAFTRLLRAHYDVSAFTDAREALERIRAGERYDLILCDLSMPGMGGVEFYLKLSTFDHDYAQRVVFLSGGVFSDSVQDFLDGVPNHTISKPFDSEALLGLIRTMTH